MLFYCRLGDGHPLSHKCLGGAVGAFKGVLDFSPIPTGDFKKWRDSRAGSWIRNCSEEKKEEKVLASFCMPSSYWSEFSPPNN